jgi:hypothetical protein
MTHAEEVKPQNITVGTFMDQWFDFAKPNLKPSTIRRYREAIEVYISNQLSGCQATQAGRCYGSRTIYSGHAAGWPISSDG